MSIIFGGAKREDMSRTSLQDSIEGGQTSIDSQRWEVCVRSNVCSANSTSRDDITFGRVVETLLGQMSNVLKYPVGVIICLIKWPSEAPHFRACTLFLIVESSHRWMRDLYAYSKRLN